MPKGEITVDIDEDAQVHFVGTGFDGIACHEAIESYARAIGKTVKEIKTCEFYKKQKACAKQKIGG